ncbi:hypothetical protein [Sunxiuqinia dokdonensis]|nr:hypothetical protein [Sunxiuqinia dokdonensis]
MKKLFFGLVFGLLVSGGLAAQDYNTAIGLRGGFESGLTVKHFIGGEAALEGILSTRWHGFNITGLYEIHNYPFAVEGLCWYYGFGGHLGFWDGYRSSRFDEDKAYTVVGLDGILGLEYSFVEVPICLSLDWKPALNVIGHSGFWGDGGALSIRYAF